MDDTTKEKIKSIINEKKVFLMMKGTPDFPQCGFSMKVVTILKNHKVDFAFLNIFEHEVLSDQIKEYSDWPTTPQLYIKGEFVGGCDIAEELERSGELKKLLEA